MTRTLPWLLGLVLTIGCDDAPGDPATLPDAAAPDAAAQDAMGPDAAPVDAAVDAEPDAATPPDAPLADRTWAAPEPWASPIDDYIAAGEAALPDDPFLRGVHDLIVFDDQLWIGYGDATYNLGRVQLIQLRAFTDPSDPTAVVAELDTRDEHLDGFRRFGDELLLPGIDAIDDAWLGNIYLRGLGGQWRMARTVDRGVHVHDVVRWGASLYAVGSGATPDAWNSGNVYGYLWVSRDDAETWDLVHQEHNQRAGDSRLTSLLPLDDALYAFGYRSNAEGNIAHFHGGGYNGSVWQPFAEDHPFRRVLVTRTNPIDLQRGFVRGANVATDPVTASIWLLEVGGTATPVAAFAGQTVIDIDRSPLTGEWVFLTRDGDTWGQTPAEWSAHIWVGADPLNPAQVLSFTPESPLLSVAAWQGAIYLGDDQGRVLKALGW
jgi:hypothetical protein